MDEVTQIFPAVPESFQPDRYPGEFEGQSTRLMIDLLKFISPVLGVISIIVFVLQYILSKFLWKNRDDWTQVGRKRSVWIAAWLITNLGI